MLLTLAVTPTDPPARMPLFELLWARAHKPSFYPLVALLIGGPALTWLAWQTPGRHRWALTVVWALFLTVLIGFFNDRAAVMLRVLWWQVSQ